MPQQSFLQRFSSQRPRRWHVVVQTTGPRRFLLHDDEEEDQDEEEDDEVENDLWPPIFSIKRNVFIRALTCPSDRVPGSPRCAWAAASS